MSRKKVSTTIYITPEQSERLRLLHDRTKVPISVYIREGIDLVLKHYEHVLPGQMTLDSATPVAAPVRTAPSAAPRGAGSTVAPAGPSEPPLRPHTPGRAGGGGEGNAAE